MKTHLVKTMLAVAVMLVLMAPQTFAGAFNIYEQGAKGMGVAGAFTARADDPSAIFHNPAGIAFLDGWHFYAGGTMITPTVKFAGVAPYPGYGVTEKTVDQSFFPPNVFGTYRISQRFAAGIGVYVPFGLATEWENKEEFTGRYISQKAELQSIYISPQLAFMVTNQLAVAAGVQLVQSTVELNRVQNQVFNGAVFDVADVTLEGSSDGLAVGFDVSALYKVHEKVQLGALFRKGVENEYKGDATFAAKSTGDPALDGLVAAGLPRNASGENVLEVATQVNFPWLFVGGIMYKATEAFSLEFNWTRFGWSEFAELPIVFSSEVKEGDVNTPEDSVIPEDYEDASQYRVGLQYQLNDRLALRGGYIYDDTPVPDQSVSVFLPDVNRHNFTLGLGYTIAGVTVDLAYMQIFGNERSTKGLNHDDYNGTYNSGASLFGVSLGYGF